MKKHITHPYLLNPTHLITAALVGVGGTGSQVLSSLARINKGLQGLGHPGIHVTVYDHDEVSESNVGRQMFSPADIGVNKAISSVTRLNRFFGYDWRAAPHEYRGEPVNIIISCTDNVKSRMYISQIFNDDKQFARNHIDHHTLMYWLDFGNTRNIGQVILGSVFKDKKHRLKSVTHLFDLSRVNEEDQGPSCSLAEALQKQDLFINSTLANLGCNILWKLITQGQLDHHGLYLNLETMNVRGIPV